MTKRTMTKRELWTRWASGVNLNQVAREAGALLSLLTVLLTSACAHSQDSTVPVNLRLPPDDEGPGTVFIPPQGEEPWDFSNRDPTAIHNTNSGNVGIDILEPAAKLHVATGADVKPQQGGFLVLGQVFDRNIALDNNEILARDGGEPATLALQADGGDLVIHSFAGALNHNVGIGVPEPRATLSIRSVRDARDDASLENFGLLLQNPNNANGSELGIGFRISSNQNVDRSPGGALTFERTGSESRGSLRFKTRATSAERDLATRMIITSSGAVGIGTTDPSSPLTVRGMIASTQGGIRFPDGTVQSTAQLTGERGPQGKRGPRGEPGPPVNTFGLCVDGGRCTCGPQATLQTISFSGLRSCTATPDNGPCTGSTVRDEFGELRQGSCCVCSPSS